MEKCIICNEDINGNHEKCRADYKILKQKYDVYEWFFFEVEKKYNDSKKK